MVDIFTEEKRSEIMSKIRSKDTKPELSVRRFLFSLGFRYRLHRKDLPGKPDIVLPKYRTIIFVNGCFWHGHDCKIGSGSRMPKTNREYWKEKIGKNIVRDRKNVKNLQEKEWNIITIWECETKDDDLLMKGLEPLLKLNKNYIASSTVSECI